MAAIYGPMTFGGASIYQSLSGETSSRVTNDFAGAFAIAALVGADFAAAFSVANLVAADAAGAYSIANVVAGNFPGSYSVSGGSASTVSADFAGAYSIVDSGPALVDKVVGITLKSKDLALRPNVGNINWAWSDARGVITSSGGGLSSNASGQVSVPIRTALLSDGIGFLSLDNYTGGNPLDYFGFFGPVRVP